MNIPCFRNLRPLLLITALWAPLLLSAQGGRPVYTGNCFTAVPKELTSDQLAELAGSVTPSARQLEWQRTAFNAFVHFGINTFTGREWGDGKEDPALFNPAKLDARQWVRTFRDAGMRTVIITAKHHDGFCLWPSAFTNHSVAASPWRGGKGDVVADVAAACRQYGLKFGFYLSPWDRHEPSYGDSAAYNTFFMNQLRELLTRYGDVAEVWFDGACGEGANGRKQAYDWQRWYALIRELQPGAVIAVMGPDVRWVGTESGIARETEWSVLPDITTAPTDPDAPFPVDAGFIPRDRMGNDLGSLTKLAGASTLAWYPAEADVSIRPGWFYHKNEDGRVKSPRELTDLYFSSAGRNAVLLLNVPPDTRGLIAEADIKSLKGMRAALARLFRINLLDGAASTASRDTIEYRLAKAGRFNVAMLREDIRAGQRIGSFRLEVWDGKRWKRFTSGTTVGDRRLLRFPVTEAARLRLVIERSRGVPALLDLGLYYDPPAKK